jgi:hypothetical protein
MAIDLQQSTLRILWEEDELVLDLGALQGLWTEEQYLKLTDQTNRLIEFAAEAGISEYWIVNPVDESITVLKLNDEAYTEHGTFRRGESAASLLLTGFAVRVDAVFDAS